MTEIPLHIPWKPMETVPTDGTIIAVRYHEWNDMKMPARIQMTQWLDPYDTGGHLCVPYDYDREVWADGWCHLTEVNP